MHHESFTGNQYQYPNEWSIWPKLYPHFENGRDVTEYFMLGRNRTPAVISSHENTCATSKRNASAQVKTHYDVSSILQVGFKFRPLKSCFKILVFILVPSSMSFGPLRHWVVTTQHLQPNRIKLKMFWYWSCGNNSILWYSVLRNKHIDLPF